MIVVLKYFSACVQNVASHNQRHDSCIDYFKKKSLNLMKMQQLDTQLFFSE